MFPTLINRRKMAKHCKEIAFLQQENSTSNLEIFLTFRYIKLDIDGKKL